jgi:hypothetical protein
MGHAPTDHAVKMDLLTRLLCSLVGGHLPPTVELNALAMKRGEPTIYTFKHAPPATTPATQQFLGQNFVIFPRMFNSRYPPYNRAFHPEPQGIYLVTLKVRSN